jgi:tetratricopeptide (TPR) repeat protein
VSANEISNEAANARIVSKLNDLTLEVQEVLGKIQNRNQKEGTTIEPVINRNLEECVRYAGKCVSAANTIAGSLSTAGSMSSEHGIQLDAQKRKEIEGWISIPEEEHWGASSIPELGARTADARTARTSFSEPITELPSDVQSRRESLRSGFTSHTQRTGHTTRLLFNDPRPELEIKVIKYWQKLASLKFNAGEYNEAEKYCKEFLDRSEAKYGTEFEGKDEATELLATVYCKQRKLPQAEAMILKQFKGRDKIMEMLATVYCQEGMWEMAQNILQAEFYGRDMVVNSLAMQFYHDKKWDETEIMLCLEFPGKDNVMKLLGAAYCKEGKWDKVENIVRSLFEGRDKILEMLAAAYCQQGKLEDASDIVCGLLERNGDVISLEALDIAHALANEYLDKRDFENAQIYCATAMRGRTETLGDAHILAYQSVYLLADIYEAQGESVLADGHRALLPVGTSSLCTIDKRIPRD